MNPLLVLTGLALLLWPRRRLHNPRRYGPPQRERWLADAVRAGYHNDGRLWARTLVEARVNRADLNAAYTRGARAREAKRRANPWQQACMLGPGHVYDFRHGGRCQCCGRLAPKRTVELHWNNGQATRYGSTCAARSLHTKPSSLRRNQLEHMERATALERERAEHYRGLHRGIRRERLGRLGGGLDRPPWAVGLTDAQLERIAREHGVRASREGWWEAAHLTSGSGELRKLLREGGYRREKTRTGAAGGTHRPPPPQLDQRRAAPRGKYVAKRTPAGTYADLPF